MQTAYTFDHADIYDIDNKNVSKLVTEEIAVRGSTSDTSSINLGLTYDKRNHPKNPTSGYYLQLTSDFAGLGGDVQYMRVNGEGRAYYPISEKITFVSRVVGGHIQGKISG